MEYFVFLFFLVLGYSFFGTKRDKVSNIYYYLLCFFFIIFWGLRYRIGGDSIRYQEMFQDLPTLYNLFEYDVQSSRNQPLWIGLNALIKTIYDDYFFFQFIHSLIVNIFLFYFVNENCRNRFLAILLYFVLFSTYFSTEILREVLSILVFLYSVKYLMLREWAKYYFLSFIAIMFHVSAIFLLLLPFISSLYKERNPIKSLCVVSFCSFLLSFFLLNLLSLLSFDSLLSDGYQNTYQNFSSGKMSYNFNGIIVNFIKQLYVFIPTFLACYLKQHREAKILFLFSIVSILGIQITILSRFYNYFYLLYIIIVSDMFINIHFKQVKSLITLSVLIILFYRINLYFDAQQFIVGKVYNRWYPYYSIFNRQNDPVREKLVDYEFYNR